MMGLKIIIIIQLSLAKADPSVRYYFQTQHRHKILYLVVKQSSLFDFVTSKTEKAFRLEFLNLSLSVTNKMAA